MTTRLDLDSAFFLWARTMHNENSMSRIPHKPIRLLGDLERRVDEVFSELIHGPWRSPSAALPWEPAIDVHESPQEYFILVDLPGVAPAEVTVSIEGQMLVLHGKRASQQWTQSGTTIHTERFQGEFVRRIPLPGAVDRSGLEVSFVHGMLLIRLPKPTAGQHGTSPVASES
jgi:HSP20 family protein